MKTLSILLIITLLASCNSNTINTENNSLNDIVIIEEEKGEDIDSEVSESEKVEYKERKVELNTKDSEVVKIILDSENTKINSESIQISGQIITIKKSGNYEFSGVLNNGQIIVETDDKKDVQIILSGVEIQNDFGPAILVKESKNTVINLSENTINKLSDAEKYSLENEDEGTGGAIFSKDDLVINGNGNLEVTGNYTDGIVSKDKLYISGANIKVEAEDDGIRGKDYLLIEDANLDLIAVADGLKSNNEEKSTILINSGNINISAGDDAIHAEMYIVFNGGNINISKSYEGIEAKYITFNDGEINVISSDDGINARVKSKNSGNDKMGERLEMGDNQGFPGEMDSDRENMHLIMDKKRNGEELTSEEQAILDKVEENRPTRLDMSFSGTMSDMGDMKMGGPDGGGEQDDGSVVYFNGGNVVLNSNGDGFDSNGKIIMTGGKITIFGPEGNGNGSIDYNGSFEMTGGEVIAIGSSGMVQTPAESDELNTINIGLASTYSFGETIVLKGSSGNEIYNLESIKKFQNIVISSNKLVTGETYILEISGKEIERITITDKITKVGSFNSRGGMKSLN